MKTGVLLTAAAGPLSNLLFAFVIALFFRVLPSVSLPESVVTLLFMTFKINVVLFVFNLIPVPPLDGSRVLVGLLPDSLGRQFAILERNPIFVILAFAALIGFAGRLMAGPIDFLTRALLMVTGNL
jgi:Zn-dependent protease